MVVVASCIHPNQRQSQSEINGRWVIEASACPYGLHPAGTLVADAAPDGTLDSTFTAANGKQFWDVAKGSRWTPRD